MRAQYWKDKFYIFLNSKQIMGSKLK